MADALKPCMKCGVNLADWPNVWCKECVEESRAAWEATKKVLEQQHPGKLDRPRCVNCFVPMDVSQDKEYCNLCTDLYLTLYNREYFLRLHRKWAYGQTL